MTYLDIVSLVLEQNVSASTNRFYLDIMSLVPDQNNLEEYRVPSQMLGALSWHQPTRSQTNNPRILVGALGYLLGSYFSLIN